MNPSPTVFYMFTKSFICLLAIAAFLCDCFKPATSNCTGHCSPLYDQAYKSNMSNRMRFNIQSYLSVTRTSQVYGWDFASFMSLAVRYI